LSGIVFAGFADRFDRKRSLVLAYAGFIAGTLCCSLAQSYESLVAARVVTGVFSGISGALVMAIIGDLFAPEQRGRVLGTVQMAFGASQVLGIPIGLLIAHQWGWQSAFLLIVLIGLVVVFLLQLKLKPVRLHLQPSSLSAVRHLWETLVHRRYLTGYVMIALLSLGGFMLMPFSSAFMVNNLGLQQIQLPLVFLVTGCSAFFVMPLVGALSDRYSKSRIFMAGSIVAVVMVLIFTQMTAAPLWAVILLNVTLFAGISGRMIPAQAIQTGIPLPRDRGAFMSISSSLQQMAGGIGAVIAGFIVQQPGSTQPLRHYDTLGYIVAFIILCSVPLVNRINRGGVPPQQKKSSKVIHLRPDLVSENG
jgi:predicted MFS family arabinose efflux permease